MINSVTIGRLGENFASELLAADGYLIAARNFRCSAGEVDIVAAKDDELVFVEVKTRRSDLFGKPAEAVNEEKKQRLRQIAVHYINRYDAQEKYVSFDVIEIDVNEIKNAF